MVHILFLLSQKLRTNRIEGITAQLVLTLHVLEDINLETPINGCFLGITLTESFRGEMSVFRDGLDTYKDDRGEYRA